LMLYFQYMGINEIAFVYLEYFSVSLLLLIIFC
jgi:hypothetical protein